MVALPGRCFPHYYQCYVPPLCVAAGWSAGRLLGPTRWPRAVGPLAVAVVLVAVACRQLPPYRWSPSEWSNRKYESENFVEQAYLARRLMTILRPGERFWILGQDNTVYFMTGQSPVTGLLYLEPIIDGGNGAIYWPRLIADLNRADPPLVVVHFPWDYDLPPDAPVIPWLHARYVSAGTNLTCPSYDLYVRRGNDEMMRKLKNPPPFPPFQRAEWGSPRARASDGAHGALIAGVSCVRRDDRSLLVERSERQTLNAACDVESGRRLRPSVPDRARRAPTAVRIWRAHTTPANGSPAAAGRLS